MSTRTCEQCSAALGASALYCGSCGRPAPPPSQPAAPRALGGATLGARLEIDAETIRHFEVGARCLLRLRVQNAGALALARVRLAARVLAGQTLPVTCVEDLAPAQCAVLALWIVPEMPGFQELGGVLELIDAAGAQSFCAFGGIQFRVARDHDGARISVVRIDQRSARVVDNSRSSFGSLALAPEGAGLVGQGDWKPVELRPVERPEAARLLPDLEQPASPAPAHAPALPALAGRAARFSVHTASGSYEARSVLARGDLATLFSGVRLGDDEPVVLKVADERGDNDLLQAELSTLRLLGAEAAPQQKHLPVALEQFEAADGRLGTVFERIDGLDLRAVRERLGGAVPPRHLIWLMRRCLSVLGWAHSCGVLHGNIDPAHILVRAQDHNVWLIDWCYAIVHPARTGQGFRCLNEVYSPPEVAQNLPPVPASDLYALGKCMIFAAGGDPASKTLPGSMDDRLQRILKFCTLESARSRAQDAWQLYAELDRVREEIWGPHQFVELKL